MFPDFGIRRFLPAHQKTAVELTPTAPGTFEFTCGMSMLRGTLVVEGSYDDEHGHDRCPRATAKVTIPLSGMTCAACQGGVQRPLRKTRGASTRRSTS